MHSRAHKTSADYCMLAQIPALAPKSPPNIRGPEQGFSFEWVGMDPTRKEKEMVLPKDPKAVRDYGLAIVRTADHTDSAVDDHVRRPHLYQQSGFTQKRHAGLPLRLHVVLVLLTMSWPLANLSCTRRTLQALTECARPTKSRIIGIAPLPKFLKTSS